MLKRSGTGRGDQEGSLLCPAQTLCLGGPSILDTPLTCPISKQVVYATCTRGSTTTLFRGVNALTFGVGAPGSALDSGSESMNEVGKVLWAGYGIPNGHGSSAGGLMSKSACLSRTSLAEQGLSLPPVPVDSWLQKSKNPFAKYVFFLLSSTHMF